MKELGKLMTLQILTTDFLNQNANKMHRKRFETHDTTLP